MKRTLTTLAALAAMCMSSASMACNWETGEREQLVFLSWDGKPVTDWTVQHGAMKVVDLPNGVKLGVEIDHPEQDKVQEQSTKTRYVPEMVKISLFNLAGDTPEQLTYTYGGTNSLQGYGASGGADRVDLLGDPGIELTLLKPVCLTMGQ